MFDVQVVSGRIFFVEFYRAVILTYDKCILVHVDTTFKEHAVYFNLLTPNVNYSGRTAPLTSKVAFYIFIQQI